MLRLRLYPCRTGVAKEPRRAFDISVLAGKGTCDWCVVGTSVGMLEKDQGGDNGERRP